MATIISVLLPLLTAALVQPVTSAGMDYRGNVAQTWPTATAYLPMIPQPGPKATPAARIHRARLQQRQQANSVCGYYQSSGQWLSVTCNYGLSCVADQTLIPVAAFCSTVGSNDVPFTAAFDFGAWPLGGCFPGDGQLCCPSTLQYWAEYEFDNGATVLYVCYIDHFVVSATTSDPAILISTTLTTPPTTTTTTVMTSSSTTAPPSSTTIQSTTPSTTTTPAPVASPVVNTPAATNTGSSSGLSTSDNIALGVGIPCGIGSIVYLYRGFVKHKWGP